MLVLEALYILNTALLAVYGLHSLILTVIYLTRSARISAHPAAEPVPGLATGRPAVTVQLPVYNERHVVRRLIYAAARLRWPADRLQIQILDDSDDDTPAIISAEVRRLATKGVHIEHLRRPLRRNFKAGALQYGLSLAQGEYIAIFDADFLPPADFLERAIPAFGDESERIGCVQGRWGHLNAGISWLTRALAMGVDGHFVVEQTARDAVRGYLNFNGTAGVWRRSCLEDSGGWQADTLTEDLDLSYRAQLRGWRIRYDPRLVVPAELPVQIDALKSQQFRWAKGSIQTACKLLPAVWRAPGGWGRKLLASLHLSNYAVHPMLLLNLLLIPIVMQSARWLIWASPFLLLGAIGPPFLYLTAARQAGRSPVRRLRQLAVLTGLGIGLSANNSRAVLEAIAGISSDFVRTPKFAITDRPDQWQQSGYTLKRDPAAWIELALALFAAGLLLLSLHHRIWGLAPWLLIYTLGYGYIAGLAFRQSRQIRQGTSRVGRRPAEN